MFTRHAGRARLVAMGGLAILFWILVMLAIAALEQFPFFDNRHT
ncbi:MAG TPA: hypothetical protein VN277_06675 [Acidiferrobacterales bacterium]|nr:hypothetical protein [Acidiferrobacterales bacterium]